MSVTTEWTPANFHSLHKERLARIRASAVYDSGIDLQRKTKPPTLALVPTTPERVIDECVAWQWAELIIAKSEYKLPNIGRVPRSQEIFSAVAKHFKVTVIDIKSHRRTADIVRPRQLCMYLTKMLTGRSLPEIGRVLGARDHTTVLHGIRKIAALRAAGDESITAQVGAIAAMLACQGFDISPLEIPAPNTESAP